MTNNIWLAGGYDSLVAPTASTGNPQLPNQSLWDAHAHTYSDTNSDTNSDTDSNAANGYANRDPNSASYAYTEAATPQCNAVPLAGRRPPVGA